MNDILICMDRNRFTRPSLCELVPYILIEVILDVPSIARVYSHDSILDPVLYSAYC